MHYFVTGATGFVGGAIVRRLLAEGHHVRALVRSPRHAQVLSVAGVSPHLGDVTDKASMRAGMAGADGVFHAAGWYKYGQRDSSAAQAVNVDGTRNVLELMQELGIARGVYTSTVVANSNTRGRVVDETYRFQGRHLSVYDRTKAEAHDLAESFVSRGLPLVIVSPGAVYGPGDTSALRALFVRAIQGRLPPLPARTAYCWGFIDDVARGHLLAMQQGQPGRVYFLTGPAHTMVEAVAFVASLLGRRPPRFTVPPAVLRAAAAVMSVGERLVPVPPEFTSEGLRVLAGVTYLGSNARARRELGWSARPLRDGLMPTLRHEMAALGLQARF